MTTDELIRYLRVFASTRYALEKKVLTEAADRLRELDLKEGTHDD